MARVASVESSVMRISTSYGRPAKASRTSAMTLRIVFSSFLVGMTTTAVWRWFSVVAKACIISNRGAAHAVRLRCTGHEQRVDIVVLEAAGHELPRTAD